MAVAIPRQAVETSVTTPVKNPVAAGVLSALLPGLGQFYCRRWLRGIGFLAAVLAIDAAAGVTGTALAVARSRVLPADLTGFLGGAAILVAIALWSVLDAIGLARATASAGRGPSP
jgi:hypothetical protein